MPTTKIEASDLAKEIERTLADYAEQVVEGLSEEVQAAGKECLKEIKDKSPKRTGGYSKSWTIRQQSKKGNSFSFVLYNKKYGQLTHLLEHGHAKASGGRVEGTPHIAPAEEAMQKRLGERVKLLVTNKWHA